MPEVTSVLVFDWKHAGFLLLFGLLTLFINLVVTKRSQLDAWVETQPRLAGVFKLLRGFGIDPWVIAQGLCLIFKGRLPEYVTQDAEELKRRFRLERAKPPILPMVAWSCIMGFVLVFALSGCAETLPAETGGAKRTHCDQAQLAVIVPRCAALSQECVTNHIAQQDCPSLKECDAEIVKVCNQ